MLVVSRQLAVQVTRELGPGSGRPSGCPRGGRDDGRGERDGTHSNAAYCPALPKPPAIPLGASGHGALRGLPRESSERWREVGLSDVTLRSQRRCPSTYVPASSLDSARCPQHSDQRPPPGDGRLRVLGRPFWFRRSGRIGGDQPRTRTDQRDQGSGCIAPPCQAIRFAS